VTKHGEDMGLESVLCLGICQTESTVAVQRRFCRCTEAQQIIVFYRHKAFISIAAISSATCSDR
jgi:hypothetical protein